MNKLLSLLTLLLIFSCSGVKRKTIDFGQFEITVPENWKKYERKGIDSYIGGIITESNDSLNFDFGMYSADISEQSLPMIYDSISLAELTKKERELLPNTKHLIVQDLFNSNVDFDEYLKYEFEYDSIDCFKAKIIMPRNKGYGGTGIYIDSLAGSNRNFDKIKFGFYGWYLNDKVQAEFIKALKTLNFKKYCSQHR
ncbi:hypothetical protein [Flavobacterium orientale]|uniref:Lipoprotein n=1 Tax=Flavobacterium orientale TaxID=1756020 RepID=A0A916Y9L6_9FLAO|nr:hypothetical protein [Flavobacterium orientale]GGD36551.1 hypothetical protein GCM10011343_27990 [Flavobacterium orientale]